MSEGQPKHIDFRRALKIAATSLGTAALLSGAAVTTEGSTPTPTHKDFIFPAPCEPRTDTNVVIEFTSLMRPEPTPNYRVIDSAKHPEPTPNNNIIIECITKTN